MDLIEKYKNLKELLDQEKFPKPYLFKFIILTESKKEEAVKACFDKTAEFKTNYSKTKKYTTINIVQKMPSSEAIIERYMAVAKIENVIHL
jgi:hypothetical protein